MNYVTLFVGVTRWFVFSYRTHMQDLKDVTNNVHYENYRSRKLAAVTYNGVDNNKNKGQLTKYVPSTLYIHIIDLSCSVYHLSLPFPTPPCDFMFQAFHSHLPLLHVWHHYPKRHSCTTTWYSQTSLQGCYTLFWRFTHSVYFIYSYLEGLEKASSYMLYLKELIANCWNYVKKKKGV